MALLLNLSAKYPKVIAPTIDPKSYIEIKKPFWLLMTSPLE